ncbi:beta-N-acetylglucosaminidase domain-containing protein [Plantactinospora sp. GCM10030261]|uniref:beta-N-acetylglucosaminidase domain-containing protein n=1 Tax=Plantactinospora sp. GCM10030261 TaxID=3273420 RepID=UPI00360B298C
MRGTVEGFYGPPWPHAERLAHLEFSARIGLDTYVYAPKDDPHHRARWREPYPHSELTQLAELAATAHGLGIRFVYAISPGLSMRFTDDGDHRALVDKAIQVYDAGIRSFAVFFDDVPIELSRPEELERWPGSGASGAAHGETCARFVADFLAPHGIREPLLVCPTDYAGTDDTDYRRHFARTAPPDVLVAWTGRDIVVGDVSRDDIDRAAASYRRRLVLWDNFPVNDFEPSRLFLGPLTGRPADLAGSALAGVLTNPMVQAVPSRIPLVSVADWSVDPSGYHPTESAERALPLVAGTGAADLAPLVRVCASWPPSADQDAELVDAVDGTLAGRTGAVELLTARLDELAVRSRAAVEPEPLVTALRPWLAAAGAMAEAGLSAVRLLAAATAAGTGAAPAGSAGERITERRDETRRALAAAESHYANVLRSIIPPFVRDVLDRTRPPGSGDDDLPTGTAPATDTAAVPESARATDTAAVPDATTAGDGPAGDRPVALLVTGARRTASDEALTELLGRRGHRVRRRAEPQPGDLADAAVVLVTRGATDPAIETVARANVPLLAWHGLVPLGLARSHEVLLARHRVRIVAPDDPLAAGLDGVVPVYRGPAKLTTAVVGPDARVVARVVDEDRPALFRYPAGARLADGTVAPASRIGLFLGADGLAPWLLTSGGRALLDAALDACPAR